jgi:predicted nucleic acid-binding protein
VILVDTAIWVDHLRAADADLIEMLRRRKVLAHPHVVGEIMLGSLRDRGVILAMLALLPRAVVAGEAEVLHFIERERLFGIGIGYLDAHLLASARLTAGAALWTRDRRMAAVAARLGVGHSLPH